MKYLLPFFLFSILCFSQNGSIRGVILDSDSLAVSGVDIRVSDTEFTSTSNENGFYRLDIPSGQPFTIKFSALGYQPIVIRDIVLDAGELFKLNPVLSRTDLQAVYLKTTTREELRGLKQIDPETIGDIPGAKPGAENLINSLPGTSSNNELSTQYGVRGGNYDENLIYINEIEVYRPLLIRSGQQEGLSVINSDLIRRLSFSAGGFQAQYGDKLSSVLDIKYRRPEEFLAGVDASLLGASIYAGGAINGGKTSVISGLRYRDNTLFVDSRDTEANTRPVFYDAQLSVVHRISTQFELEFLGNIAVNKYEFRPITRQTRFGTAGDARAVVIDYDGLEDDQYETYFGALKASYEVNKNLNLRVISSVYHTQEQEHYDILARYGLGRPDSELGNANEIVNVIAAGTELEHGRNDLDGLIANLQLRGTYEVPSDKTEKDLLEFGVKYQREDFRDRVREYTVLDSAGFQLRPPIDQFRRDEPYEPFTGPLEPFESIRAFNEVATDRFEAFVQYGARGYWKDNEIFWNFGVRSSTWQVSVPDRESVVQSVFSPRGQFAIRPDWETDMIFRVASGLYYQPPFYRELRDPSGRVVPNVQAQRSFHFIVGNDFQFTMRGRPFKLVTEAYYKDLGDVNTYTLENVRIRYRANNDAVAYAYGLDMRLNGEFVPGTESWISASYLKTEERLGGRDTNISRPTDQRLKFAVLFQDYVPKFPQFRVYLNLVYNTGLPGGSPSYADPYLYQFRLRDYSRSDLGLNYVFKDSKQRNLDWPFLQNFKELILGVEVFNMFGRNNQITNIWVRDISSGQQVAIPNNLTPQVLNVRLKAKF